MEEFDNIKIEELREAIRNFNNDENVNKLENYYYSKSLPEIMGISRKELAHSSFLAWILNTNESHMLGDYPIKKFLELLKDKQRKNKKELFDAITVSDIELTDTYVETEKAITGVGRLDIYVETKIKYGNKSKNVRLIIENKVGSKEHGDQTQKYFDYYENSKTDNYINLYVYLTPISSLDLSELEEPECSCKSYIQINYQSIVDFILEPSLQGNITDKTRFIIKEYLQSLSQPTLDKENNEYKQGLIMALGTDERNLLTKFWEKNQKLILAALDAIGSDPDRDEDTRNSVKKALKSLSNNTNYSVIFNGEVEFKNINKAGLATAIVEILDKHKQINDGVFEYLLKESPRILRKERKEKSWHKFKYKETEYYIVRGQTITTNRVDGFIKKIEKDFPNLKIVPEQQ